MIKSRKNILAGTLWALRKNIKLKIHDISLLKLSNNGLHTFNLNVIFKFLIKNQTFIYN